MSCNPFLTNDLDRNAFLGVAVDRAIPAPTTTGVASQLFNDVIVNFKKSQDYSGSSVEETKKHYAHAGRYIRKAVCAVGGDTTLEAFDSLVVRAFKKLTGNSVEFTVSDTLVGTGAIAEDKKEVTINYNVYKIEAGKKGGIIFSSSPNISSLVYNPHTFTIGVGEKNLIKGLEQGITGMKVGGKRTLIVPSHLAWGIDKLGQNLRNADVIYEIELLKVK